MVKIIDCTNFGHGQNKGNTSIIYDIVHICKAKYIFTRMDLDGVHIDYNAILKGQKKAGHVNPLDR